MMMSTGVTTANNRASQTEEFCVLCFVYFKTDLRFSGTVYYKLNKHKSM